MQPSIEVVERHDDLHRTRWRFAYLPNGAVLDQWADERRETRRHKFKASAWDRTVWSRLHHARENRIERPQVPRHIASEVLRLFAETLTFAEGEI